MLSTISYLIIGVILNNLPAKLSYKDNPAAYRKWYQELHKDEIKHQKHGYYVKHKQDIINKSVEYQRQHKITRRLYEKEYWNQHPEALQAKRDRQITNRRRYATDVKLIVFKAYGGAFCTCCGENEFDFLELDHINGGGTRQRHTDKIAGNKLLYWIIRNKYPAGFQVLCSNCNRSKGKPSNYNKCVHQIKSELVKEKQQVRIIGAT